MSHAQATQNRPAPSAQKEVHLRPAAELFQSENGFTIYVEMPGTDHSTVDVSLEQNELTITGTANFAAPEGARHVAGLAGSRIYKRIFRLSDEIDREKITAEVKQGVLTLQLQKSAAAQKVQLQVKGA